MYSESVTLNSGGGIVSKEQHHNSYNVDDSPAAMEMVDDKPKPICIPGNSVIIIPGKNSNVNMKK